MQSRKHFPSTWIECYSQFITLQPGGFFEMRFTKLQDIPSEYRALINLLIEKGIIVVTNDEFEYPLSLDQLYLIRIIQRMI